MSHFFKKYFITFFIGGALLGLFFINHSDDQKSSSDKLIVGIQSGYPPFEYLNEEGKITGFDIELGGVIAKQLGKQLVIKDMDFDGLILSLKQGKIDLIMSGMDITPSRLKKIAMIPYHGQEAKSLSLIFWNKIPDGIHSIEDVALLPNAAISVESGTTAEAVMKHFSNIATKSFQGALNPLMDVKFGKSTANLVEDDVAHYLKTKHPQVNILSVPLPQETEVLGFGIGVNKDNQVLIHEVEEVIQEFKASGKLKQLENKWFKGKDI